jgi:uncharacterized Zn finger protein (UPF0148 family)
MEEKQTVEEIIIDEDMKPVDFCPKCKAPMVRSIVTGALVPTCFCGSAVNYVEQDRKRRKAEAKEKASGVKKPMGLIVKVKDIKNTTV